MPIYVGYSGEWINPKDLYVKDAASGEWVKATDVYVGVNGQWVLVDKDIPPPPIGDPHWDKVVSLLHFDGVEGDTSVTDQKGVSWVFEGNAKITRIITGPFGGACVTFPGGGRLIADAIDSLRLGVEDFTLEFFIRRSGVGVIFDNRFGTYDGVMPISVANNETRITFRDTLAGEIRTGDLTTNTWYHYSLVRQSGVIVQFIHGVKQAGQYNTLDNYSNNIIALGSSFVGPTTASFVGQMAEWRLTKGVARYTEDFTPPIEPFPNHGTGGTP